MFTVLFFHSKAKPQIVLSNYRRQSSVITSLLANVNMKFKRQYIHNIFQSNAIKFLKATIRLILAKLIHICEARSSQLPCFSFVYFQPLRKLHPL